MEQNMLYLDAACKLAAVASDLGHGGAPSEQVYAILDRVLCLTELANKETEKFIARLGRRDEHTQPDHTE